MSRRSKKNHIAGPFVAHSLEMRTSIAWRFLPMNARRVVDLLEVEHMNQGGAENGKLKQTHKDLERGGVPRKAVTLSIRQTEALGFVECTFRAQPSIAEFRRCNEYRLTFLSGRGEKAPAATHDWRRIQTEEQAKAALLAAGQYRSPEHVRKAVRSLPSKARSAAI